VPQSFTYNNKNYTPQSFLKEAMGINLNDYVEITSYSNHPFFTKYILEDKYNWTGDEYYNVPIKDFSAITDNALKNGYTISWDGDAEEATFEYGKGLAYLPFTGKDFQKERQRTVEDSSTQITHMMHIVGSVKDKTGAKWYCVKNSWGDYSNELEGYMFMSDAYFKIKTGAIIVNKKAIPADICKKMRL
jgi:bleomycin hydrolase